MTYRMTIAALTLVNALVALYLHLWKLGLAGTLKCTGNHGCEIAQFSSYGWFLGIDVALIGTIGYTLLLVVSVLGTMPRWEDRPWPTMVLMALVLPALAFTVRLKYGEFVVLKTFCPWCAISAVSITLCTILVFLDWRRLRRMDVVGTPATVSP
jgi:uncharacterized membrane protein